MMRSANANLLTVVAALVFACMLSWGASPAVAQQQAPQIDVEVEPIAYAFGGAEVTVSYQPGHWRYSLEAFGLKVPEALHGHETFEPSILGAELHAERFFGDAPSGFFLGPEIGISRQELTHTSGTSERSVGYSIGVRGGYRFYVGLGDLYLSPQGGLVYALNAEATTIEGDTFETGPITPFVTVGLGWSF